MASAGKGLPFIGKMNEFLDKVLHPTVQKAGNSRAALEVINKGYYLIDTDAFIVEAGSTDNIIKVTGHPFKEGDSVRLYTTANSIKEQEITIDEIVDANTVKLAGYLSASLTTGDEFYVRRPISELFASDGSRLASLSYLKDGAATEVSRNTVDPELSTALPVEIMGANGMVLNVTTGDLAIQSFHEDRVINAVTVPGDSIRIGDGTTLAHVTLANELKSHDEDVLQELLTLNASDLATETTLASLEGKDFATEATLDAMKTIQTDGTQKTKITDGAGVVNTKQLGTAVTSSDVGLVTNSVIHGLTTGGGGGYVDVKVNPSGALTVEASVTSSTLPSGAATSALQTTGNNSLSSIDTKLSSQATAAKQDAHAVLFGAVNETAPASDTASSGLNGRLQRIAQNISAMILQLPATLGIKTAANSLSIAPASDAIFNIKPKAITSSFAENLSLSTVATFTAPANAIGGLIMADDTNTANIRFKQGGTATVSSGLQLQAGRSEPIGSGTDISICAESGTQKVMIIWNIQA